MDLEVSQSFPFREEAFEITYYSFRMTLIVNRNVCNIMLYTYVCIHMYVYIYIYIFIYTYIYTYTYTYIHMFYMHDIIYIRLNYKALTATSLHWNDG